MEWAGSATLLSHLMGRRARDTRQALHRRWSMTRSRLWQSMPVATNRSLSVQAREPQPQSKETLHWQLLAQQAVASRVWSQRWFCHLTPPNKSRGRPWPLATCNRLAANSKSKQWRWSVASLCASLSHLCRVTWASKAPTRRFVALCPIQTTSSRLLRWTHMVTSLGKRAFWNRTV